MTVGAGGMRICLGGTVQSCPRLYWQAWLASWLAGGERGWRGLWVVWEGWQLWGGLEALPIEFVAAILVACGFLLSAQARKGGRGHCMLQQPSCSTSSCSCYFLSVGQLYPPTRSWRQTSLAAGADEPVSTGTGQALLGDTCLVLWVE